MIRYSYISLLSVIDEDEIMAVNTQFIDKWVTYLQTGDPEMSRIAAQKLASTGDPVVIPELQKALRGRPDDVRTAAIRALGEIGHADAVLALVKQLDDNNSVIASSAAESLGKIGDPRAVKPLIQVIERYKREQSHDTQIRGFTRGLFMSAIYALKQINTPEAKRAISRYHQ